MVESALTVDGVEVKTTLTGGQIDAALSSFGLEPGDAARRTISFFDALDGPDTARSRRPLRLLTANIILRIRRRPNGRAESTVKLRPADPHRLTGHWAAGSDHRGEYRVEYDWAARPVLAASLDADLDDRDLVDAVLTSQHPLEEAFTTEQQSFLQECGSPPAHPFRDLEPAGPITALRWDDIETGPFTGELSLRAEQWTYAGGPPFLELSLRTREVDNAQTLRDQLAAELGQRGLHADPLAETKTETVLRALLQPA